MRNLVVSAAAIAAAALFTPGPAHAQFGFGGPGFGVQIGGGPYYGGGYGYQPQPYYGGYRAYDDDEPVVVQRRVYSGYDEPVVQRRIYRQRDVGMRYCRTVTVQRYDGSLKRVRRCG
ncbi:MAG: hypothetical protein QOH67_3088 [Hyphomicrobiales bacterium]|jgi:hypothetical protein|nr:hypothetical protein [Hyphomicrobiales bacterium]